MTTRKVKNIAASVREKLLVRSRKTGENFQFLLQHYAAERFLYRLSQSSHREQFVLKGAMLFSLWGGPSYRPTRDLDFMGYGSSESDLILKSFREMCDIAVVDDGLLFDPATMSIEHIREDVEYNGLRVKFYAFLHNARIFIQIDIGFGDAIEPPAYEADYPTLLDFPMPRIRAYPQEAVVAEKFHTMVLRGEINSRYKDFYDLYILAKHFPFKGSLLSNSIHATFIRRRTGFDIALPVALARNFYIDTERSKRWRTYLNKNTLPGVPDDFNSAGAMIQSFLSPIWDALAEQKAFDMFWPAGGPWREKE